MENIKKIENTEIRSLGNMLCISDLLVANKEYCKREFKKEKRFNDFFKEKDSFEYLHELLKLQGIDTSIFVDVYRALGLKQALNEINQYKVTGRGINKAIFCNHYIFIAVAQWLNPRFRAFVTMWATDTLILNRIEAGHDYSQLCATISQHILPKISDNAKKFIYSNFAKLINKKVFGEHSDNLRQIASKEQLKELNRVQTKLAALIEVGYISNYQDAKNYLNI